MIPPNAWKHGRLLESYEVLQVHTKPDLIAYGQVEHTVAKRRCLCRACGEFIFQGEARITFFWDFNGCGSWTAMECHMHERDCTGVVNGNLPHTSTLV